MFNAKFSIVNSPCECIGSRKKKPVQEMVSPASVVPVNVWGFLLSGLVSKWSSVKVMGPTVRWNGRR